ncbi:MAG: hypothetical protein VYE22_06515 [Myxococcota bacterium]|nr:hypothetical protein [Myxococcota bacterium]
MTQLTSQPTAQTATASAASASDRGTDVLPTDALLRGVGRLSVVLVLVVLLALVVLITGGGALLG